MKSKNMTTRLNSLAQSYQKIRKSLQHIKANHNVFAEVTSLSSKLWDLYHVTGLYLEESKKEKENDCIRDNNKAECSSENNRQSAQNARN